MKRFVKKYTLYLDDEIRPIFISSNLQNVLLVARQYSDDGISLYTLNDLLSKAIISEYIFKNTIDNRIIKIVCEIE